MGSPSRLFLFMPGTFWYVHFTSFYYMLFCLGTNSHEFRQLTSWACFWKYVCKASSSLSLSDTSSSMVNGADRHQFLFFEPCRLTGFVGQFSTSIYWTWFCFLLWIEMLTIQPGFCRVFTFWVDSILLVVKDNICLFVSIANDSIFFCHDGMYKSLTLCLSYAFESNHQEMDVAMIFDGFIPGHLFIAIVHTFVLLMVFPLLVYLCYKTYL